jgi:hypothetical protein
MSFCPNKNLRKDNIDLCCPIKEPLATCSPWALETRLVQIEKQCQCNAQNVLRRPSIQRRMQNISLRIILLYITIMFHYYHHHHYHQHHFSFRFCKWTKTWNIWLFELGLFHLTWWPPQGISGSWVGKSKRESKCTIYINDTLYIYHIYNMLYHIYHNETHQTVWERVTKERRNGNIV